MAAGGSAWFKSLPVVLCWAAFCLRVWLGPDAHPRYDEPLPEYSRRVLATGLQAAEEAYLRLLVSIPGGAQATVGRRGGAAATAWPSEAAASTPEPSPEVAGLKQRAALDEREILSQRDASTRLYQQVKREAAAAGGEEPLVLPEQPDEVRQRMPSVDPEGPEMRCGQAIRSESSVITRGVELRARADFQGKHGAQHAWKYTVTFINRGQETVQMLARHWVFVNAKGRLETEVKGPGARGVTPVLAPGGEWSYESGTSLSTAFGSMHGSFQFEVLKGDTRPSGRSFSARVGRLLLSAREESRKVPCVAGADAELLPLTSVLAIERVILGGRAEPMRGGKAKGGQKSHRFAYDVQFNNARDAAIEVVGHSWTVVDSEGRRKVVAEGPGVGGSHGGRLRQLAAGDAFRVQGELAAATPTANAEGTYRVIIKADDGTFQEIEVRTDYMGLSADGSVTHVPNFVARGGLR